MYTVRYMEIILNYNVLKAVKGAGEGLSLGMKA